MAEQKVGIENLKKAVVLTIESIKAGTAQFSDGFQPLPDLLALLGTGTQIQQMIKSSGKAIKDEFLDVDKGEGAELNKLVAEKFSLDNKRAERITEAAINLLWGFIFLADEFKEPGDATTPA